MSSLPPIPASPFMLDHLLGWTFLLHLIFMNFVAVAPIIIALYLFKQGNKGRQRAYWLSAPLPVAFTFTITTGIAPLLFVQALFTEQFYTANILLGNRWLGLIAYMLIAFYGTYILKHLIKNESYSSNLVACLALVIGVFVWLVGHTMIANYTLTANQAEWQNYQQKQWALLHDPSFLPRAFHFLVGSTAVTGFWMAWIAWWHLKKQDSIELQKLKHQGLMLAASATGLQLIVGVWFVLRLSPEAWNKLFSGSFVSTVWLSSIATALILFGCLIAAAMSPAKLLWQKISTALLLYTLFGMIAGREVVRLTAFGDSFQIRTLPSTPQGSPQTLFMLLLLFAVAVIAYLIRLVWKLPPDKTS